MPPKENYLNRQQKCIRDALSKRSLSSLQNGMVSGVDINFLIPIDIAQREGVRHDLVTPLHLVIYEGWRAGFKCLINRANLNETTRAGYTPLHAAIHSQDQKTALDLIRKRADLTIEDPQRNTPLHLAVEHGLDTIVEHLVTHGAALDAINAKGMTPLEQAITSQAWGIASALLSTAIQQGIQLTLEANHKSRFEQYASQQRWWTVLQRLKMVEVVKEVECQSCFNTTSETKAVPCEGEDTHYFCFDCTDRLGEYHIEKGKHELICSFTGGCGAMLDIKRARTALSAVHAKQLEELEGLAQVSKAGIELESCPFCGLKGECRPEYYEFFCECGKVSCRACRQEEHPFQSCQKAAKVREENRSVHNQVAEAMSRAAIRYCPKCEVPITKKKGCNTMPCTKCGCVLCYQCRKDITHTTGHDHFWYGPCEVFGNHDVQEIMAAKKRKIEELQAKGFEIDKATLALDVDEQDLFNNNEEEGYPEDHLLIPPPRTPLNDDHLLIPPPLNDDHLLIPPPLEGYPRQIEQMTPTLPLQGGGFDDTLSNPIGYPLPARSRYRVGLQPTTEEYNSYYPISQGPVESSAREAMGNLPYSPLRYTPPIDRQTQFAYDWRNGASRGAFPNTGPIQSAPHREIMSNPVYPPTDRHHDRSNYTRPRPSLPLDNRFFQQESLRSQRPSSHRSSRLKHIP